ncbi:MAG: class flavin-dependent oxidoreductase [Acidimicrobiaceae bacterium]|nr:class flavin-dependent oxidoreductase [Acidimicrobiaceae bacterium]
MSERDTVHPWVAEGSRKIRFSVFSVFLREWADVVKAAQRAERLGFDGYWAHDHPNRLMDCWTQLTMLAMATERIRLISLVSCVYYRLPHLLARQAADVDRVSDGRLVLGIGIGDDVPEFDQMCLPFPPVADRQAALEETIDIVHGLWSGEPFTYEGKHFQVKDAALRTLPVQQPHVPILIGGGGERVTLRQVARYADMSNFAPHEWAGAAYKTSDVERKYAVLKQHCLDVGRPYESILRSHFTPFVILAENEQALEKKRKSARIPDAALHQEIVVATPAEAILHFQALADVGVQYFLASVDGEDEESFNLLAEAVIPYVRLGSEQ